MDKFCYMIAGLVIGFLPGCLISMGLRSSVIIKETNSQWEARLVDSPEYICAIRSRVIAQRKVEKFKQIELKSSE